MKITAIVVNITTKKIHCPGFIKSVKLMLALQTVHHIPEINTFARGHFELIMDILRHEQGHLYRDILENLLTKCSNINTTTNTLLIPLFKSQRQLRYPQNSHPIK